VYDFKILFLLLYVKPIDASMCQDMRWAKRQQFH